MKICNKCGSEYKPNSNNQKYCNRCKEKRKKIGRPNKYPLYVSKLLKKYHSGYIQHIIKRYYREDLSHLKLKYSLLEQEYERIRSMNTREYNEYTKGDEFKQKKIWRELELKTAMKCIYQFIKVNEVIEFDNISRVHVEYDKDGKKVLFDRFGDRVST